MDSRQCSDAVLPEALCRQKALPGGSSVLHHGQLWVADWHAAMGAYLLCHDWLDHLPGVQSKAVYLVYIVRIMQHACSMVSGHMRRAAT